MQLRKINTQRRFYALPSIPQNYFDEKALVNYVSLLHYKFNNILLEQVCIGRDSLALLRKILPRTLPTSSSILQQQTTPATENRTWFHNVLPYDMHFKKRFLLFFFLVTKMADITLFVPSISFGILFNNVTKFLNGFFFFFIT